MALNSYGIPSLSDLLNNARLDNAVYDGRMSTFPQDVATGQTVAQYFKAKASSVGAEVFQPNYGSPGDTGSSNVLFLGPAFFDPNLAGVSGPNSGLAQAFMVLHEAVHLVGNKTDADFGGSKNLTKTLVDKCFPVVAATNWLGNLY